MSSVPPVDGGSRSAPALARLRLAAVAAWAACSAWRRAVRRALNIRDLPCIQRGGPAPPSLWTPRRRPPGGGSGGSLFTRDGTGKGTVKLVSLSCHYVVRPEILRRGLRQADEPAANVGGPAVLH